MAHKWANWLHNRAGDQINSDPQMGGLATCMYSFSVKSCNFLPLGREARRTLSGRGGGATRAPATFSCKAENQ